MDKNKTIPAPKDSRVEYIEPNVGHLFVGWDEFQEQARQRRAEAEAKQLAEQEELAKEEERLRAKAEAEAAEKAKAEQKEHEERLAAISAAEVEKARLELEKAKASQQVINVNIASAKPAKKDPVGRVVRVVVNIVKTVLGIALAAIVCMLVSVWLQNPHADLFELVQGCKQIVLNVIQNIKDLIPW